MYVYTLYHAVQVKTTLHFAKAQGQFNVTFRAFGSRSGRIRIFVSCIRIRLSICIQNIRQKQNKNRIFRKNLTAVPYRGLSISPQYYTAGRSFTKKYIDSAKSYQNRKYFNPSWSLAQAGLNDEENLRAKISLDGPFKYLFYF